jgi:hypothetical protein
MWGERKEGKNEGRKKEEEKEKDENVRQEGNT